MISSCMCNCLNVSSSLEGVCLLSEDNWSSPLDGTALREFASNEKQRNLQARTSINVKKSTLGPGFNPHSGPYGIKLGRDHIIIAWFSMQPF